MITLDLTGKRALVTGASQGLGAATARALHAAGAHTILFLTSPLASSITGQPLSVNGGQIG